MYKNKFFAIFIFFAIILNLNTSASNDPKKVDNFSLKDYNGKTHSLTDFSDSEALVIMFIATKCPVSNDYNSRMEKLFLDYSGKGVTFLGINSNKQEDAAEVKKHAEENSLNFVILKDPGNLIADKFEASVTPEVYVLSKELEVLYHGRIDDSRRESEIEIKDLRLALDEILEGNNPKVSKTKAFGCSIKRVAK